VYTSLLLPLENLFLVILFFLFRLKYLCLVEQGATGSVSPTGTIPAGANVGYSLPTGTTLPTGISLNEGTGAISISVAAETKTKTAYTIVATATGTGYTGSKETSVSITIAGKDVSAYNLSYEETTVENRTGGSIDPEGDIPTGANVRYALATGSSLPGGMALDGGTLFSTVVSS
jgi:hypothetical protein